MTNQRREHRYVALSSVIVVLFSSIALFGLACFGAAFVYRWVNNDSGYWDVFHLKADVPAFVLVISILVLFIVLLLLLFRAIYTLNHPVTVLVTLQYYDERGNLISITRESSDPDARKKLEKDRKGERFQHLTALDKRYPKKVFINSTEGLSLAYICQRFRSFCSRIEGNPLYYSIDDIRRFVASLGVSKILILQGMSGTGKTSLPVAWGKFTNVNATIIPVQPMWKERSDLLGYFNEFTGKFNETMILEKLYEAGKTDRMHLIVLDEMNIARIEYYFAEFLSLLELPNPNERILEVTSTISKKDPKDLHAGKLVLPDNVYFVGTANNDDSTFAISDKVYDRSMVLNLDYRCEPFLGEGDYLPIALSDNTFKNLVKKAKKEYALTKRSRMHIKEFDKYIQEVFSITFGNRIRRQIESYVPIYIACGGKEVEAIDDILAKKVLRKLEAQNPIYVKTKSDEIISKINEIFGQDMMPVCEAYIRKVANNS